MLSPATIARYVTSRRMDQLLEAIIANGQYLPMVIKVWLNEVGHTPALSLGLKRVVELSRRPTPASDMLTEALLDAQAEDGAFDHDPLATALAAAAFFHLRHDHHTQDPKVIDAHQRALAWLAQNQFLNGDGLFYNNTGMDPNRQATFTAYILQLLARDPKARQLLALDELLHTMTTHQLAGRNPNHNQSHGHGPSNHQSQGHDKDTQSFLRIARAALPRTPAVAAA